MDYSNVGSISEEKGCLGKEMSKKKDRRVFTEVMKRKTSRDLNIVHYSILGGVNGKESACQCRRPKRHRVDP